MYAEAETFDALLGQCKPVCSGTAGSAAPFALDLCIFGKDRIFPPDAFADSIGPSRTFMGFPYSSIRIH